MKSFAFFKDNKCVHLFNLKECWRGNKNEEFCLEIILQSSCMLAYHSTCPRPRYRIPTGEIHHFITTVDAIALLDENADYLEVTT